ncbi:AMP-binding protein [Georgenia satyanarayanai]|uniref:AMP-binding protein n=1 Tax=Georgenia satyanarayanai TaxID=860221 RepID=UPI00203C02BB|nr:AMP-binding protein [Georgenia satyanarayanai]MCM3660201.1 AMP-binding protein [Georgenia satyanarayanai]
MRSQDSRPVTVLPGGTGVPAVTAVLAAVPQALEGTGPALRVTDPLAPPPPARTARAGVAALVATSGSTSGTGHLVALDGAGLVASARATSARLAGPGQWVACLPVHHVAGLQVLVRSVVAGTEPVVLDTSAGFRAGDLAAAVRRLRSDVPGYLSLVPTQLARVMADEDAVAALRGLAAVLVGGARTAGALLTAARDAGVPVVTTYGMTETGGGCVYDGVPLDGVDVEVDAEGRIWLAGPVLARGYLDDPAADRDTFRERDGRRWLRTNDRGSLTGATLTVLGRLDDVLVTGGLNVSAAAVEQALGELPGAEEAVVVGVPDEHWGALVTAVVAGDDVPSLAQVREHVAARLGRHHAPRALVRLPELPLRGPGKVDRLAAARLATELLTAADPRAERMP